MTPPRDESQRQLFIDSLDRSISVIAPAGVGKTESIVRRVAQLAKQPDAVDRLRRLTVVTYTRRAAREMKRRALERLSGEAPDPEVRFAMQSAFFGTIHSFALLLLGRHGHHLGLASELTDANDRRVAEIWRLFLREAEIVEEILAEARDCRLLRLVSARSILGEAFKAAVPETPAPAPGLLEEPDLAPILDFVPRSKSGRENIEKSQESARAWLTLWRSGDGFAGMPVKHGSSHDFGELWEWRFDPLVSWQARAQRHFTDRLAIAFAEFRVRQACLTFDDQIRLAGQLMRQPEARAAIEAERRIVILDEAQDTDETQFAFLMAVAGVEERADHGRFCMVGDFQQAIFGSRADPAAYRRAAEALRRRGGEEARFEVTFRCDEAIVQATNGLFSQIFDGVDGQADHAPLAPAPKAGAGRVERWIMGPSARETGEKKDAAWLVSTEAQRLAAWLSELGLGRIGARSWGEIAILATKRTWCRDIEDALRAERIPVQRVGSRAGRGDLPSFRWTAALLRVMAEPRNEFEIAGVLREVWGVKDTILYGHRVRSGRSLALDSETAQYFPALVELKKIWETVRELPLADAVRVLLERVRMRGRLLSLPPQATGDYGQDLEVILAEARTAEREGWSLAQFAQRFADALDDDAPAEEPRPEAVQVCTLHKAKGLQWPVVILPFLACNSDPGSRDVDSMPDLEEEGAFLERRRLYREERREERMRERARLLYVGMTRPKHALYLIDDRPLAEGVRGTGGANSLIGFLDDQPTFDNLPAQAVQPGDAQPMLMELGAAPPRLGPRVEVDWGGHLERITPHRLAVYPVIESPGERLLETLEPPPRDAASRASQQASHDYGDWWHRTCERTPWTAGPEAWERVWQEELAQCPEPKRGGESLERFRQSLAARFFIERLDWIIQQEVPVFTPAEGNGRPRCFDGFVDLAAISPDRREGFVLDWKTNRQTAILVAEYAPQVHAYAEALTRTFGIPFRGWIYATESGELLDICRVDPAQPA